MQIKQERLLDFLGKGGTRFVIPVFQRVYSWNARQCEELWDDIMRVGLADDGEGPPSVESLASGKMATGMPFWIVRMMAFRLGISG